MEKFGRMHRAGEIRTCDETRFWEKRGVDASLREKKREWNLQDLSCC